MIYMQMRRLESLTWQQKLMLALGGTAVLALAIGLIILSAALAVVLLPIVIVAGLIARWRFGKMLREAQARAAEEEMARRTAAGQRVIDADFEVVRDNGPRN